MFCPNCGVFLNDGASFCHECGCKVESSADYSYTSSGKTRIEEEIDSIYANSKSGLDVGKVINTRRRTNIIKAVLSIVGVIIVITVIVNMARFVGNNVSESGYVLMVKSGCPYLYPDTTYGEVFSYYFDDGNWEYFKGTREGPDDDGDGFPDYTESNIDIVQFTGSGMYYGVLDDVLIQFELDFDTDTFNVEYLELDGVPQSTWETSAFIAIVFETYLDNHGDL